MNCECRTQTEFYEEEAAAYVREHLRRVWRSPDGWTQEYECPTTGIRWILQWPESYLQGGGPKILKRKDQFQGNVPTPDELGPGVLPSDL